MASNVQPPAASDPHQNPLPISSTDTNSNSLNPTQSNPEPNEIDTVQQQQQKQNTTSGPITTVNGKSSFRRVKARSSRACEVYELLFIFYFCCW